MENSDAPVKPSAQAEQELNDKIEGTSYLMDTSDRQRMGIIKSIDSDKPFDHASHKSEYDKIADFVVKYVQNEMRNTYCLQEVGFPENADLAAKYHCMPRCPIFMTANFQKGN